MFELNSNEGYFLHLIKTELKNEQPEEKPSEVEWNKVFEIGLRQNAANLAWFSIEKLNNPPEGELFNQWQEVYAKAASKCLKQMMETDLLSEAFTSKSYDIMFLKGSKIREYYPSPDMRTMTDIDLLVKAEDREPVRELMRSLGYEDDLLNDGQVDAFKKLPVIYVEVHYDFSAENHIYHEMFSIDWDKLVKTDKDHIYEMTFEDLYFFNVGHYAKNMHNRGMGIRAILDCFVLWNAANDEQKENILKKFESTELKEFNNNLLKIADIWFNDTDDDGSLDNVQSYLLKTKTYGSYKNEIVLGAARNINSDSKLKYVFSKVFPSAEYLYKRFNVKQQPLLLPILWLLRIILLIFSKKEKKEHVRNQYNTFEQISAEDIDYEIHIRREFGLKGN